MFAFGYVFLSAQDFMLPCRPGVIPQQAPFYHGVASGDPLSDRVIIWTRVTLPLDAVRGSQTTDIDLVDSMGQAVTFDSTVTVNWQMATDVNFTNIVQQNSTTTDSSTDYCVKVDVTGLQSNTWYYYRFSTGGVYSITGRTRTLPVGNVDSLRFAAFSCSDFQSGYFNSYNDISKRNDLDAVMHLGDYYYEYEAGGSDYQNDTTRLHPLNHDAITIADYRLWQSQYHLDLDQQAIFQQYPWIQIWDDHDVANNSWNSGAQNHNPATQGSWYARKARAFKAYFEWLPIRETAPGNDSIVHRNFKWGNLLNLIMLDTRYEGRDSSLGSLIPLTNAYLTNPNRQMLGPAQLSWVESQLSDTSVQWRIFGNQVMIAPLDFGGSILNGDQWDGYPAERKRVFDYIMQQNIKDVVFVTGDIHSSWASDLPHPDSTYVAATGAGSVATEFIGTSVTSTATGLSGIQTLLLSGNPHIKYLEATKRGYLLFDVNKHRAQGDFIHISQVATRNYTTSDDAQWMNVDGNRFLSPAPTSIPPRNTNPPLVATTVAINEVPAENMIVLTCYPNPTDNEVYVQYYLNEASKVDLNVYDLKGALISHRSEQQSHPGVFNTKFYLDGLAAGTYIIHISDGNKVLSRKIVKSK